MLFGTENIFLSVLKKMRTFLFSWDALIYCLFCLFAAALWYAHALTKLPQDTSHEEVVADKTEYTEKVLRLHVSARGVPRGSVMVLFPEEVTVTARVSMDQYSNLSEDDFKAVCTYKSGKEMLPVEVSCSSPDVTSLRVSPKQVEYLIEKKHD